MAKTKDGQPDRHLYPAAPILLRVPRGTLGRDDRRVDWDEVGDGTHRTFDPSKLED